MIDGGKGQLGMALAAARDVGIDVRPGVGLPIVGLAKERDVALRRRGRRRADDDRPWRRRGRRRTTSARVTRGELRAEARRPRAEAEPRRGRSRAAAAARRRARVPASSKPTPKHPDRVFLPHAKDAIPIRPNTAEMFVLQHLRDEAHRFAVTFHRQQRKRLTLRSALSAIPGIGEGRQRLLLRHFGSLKKIRESSLEDLAAVPGMTRKAAEAVYAHWKKQPLPIESAAGSPAATAAAPAEAEEDAVESAFAEIEADAGEDASSSRRNDPPRSETEKFDGAVGQGSLMWVYVHRAPGRRRRLMAAKTQAESSPRGGRPTQRHEIVGILSMAFALFALLSLLSMQLGIEPDDGAGGRGDRGRPLHAGRPGRVSVDRRPDGRGGALLPRAAAWSPVRARRRRCCCCWARSRSCCTCRSRDARPRFTVRAACSASTWARSPPASSASSARRWPARRCCSCRCCC